MRPVCVGCAVEMRCVKNGAPVIETDENGVERAAWAGDKYACPTCGQQIICGYGRQPMSERFRPGWDSDLSEYISSGHAVVVK